MVLICFITSRITYVFLKLLFTCHTPIFPPSRIAHPQGGGGARGSEHLFLLTWTPKGVKQTRGLVFNTAFTR